MDYVEIMVLVTVIISAVLFLAYMSKKGLGGGGGGASNIVAGATMDMLNEEKRNARDYVLEMEEGKKMEEQKSGQPDNE